jgi:hypothetical protein
MEDKAGESAFKMDQARKYSDQLNSGMKIGKDDVDGVIYLFDSPGAADAALLSMKNAKPPIHAAIFVAFVGDKGKIHFLPRN